MSKVRVHISASLDGYVAGPSQSQEEPLGEGGERLHDWLIVLKAWREGSGLEGGEENVSNTVVAEEHANVGAEIMGRGKFGPQKGPWADLEWEGWWGDEPPFHTPVFVLTHHVRPSISLSDTTFHFIDADPHDALRQAKAAADGKDVRLGGGVATVREFLEADLVDTMHVAVAPVEIGRGGRLWDSPEDLLERFHHERIPSPSGVVHHLFWHR